MANNTITFDPAAGVAYGVNLNINKGADFRSTFQVKNNDTSNFDFTGYTGEAKMKRSNNVGSSVAIAATFTVGFTSAAAGQFNISLTDTVTNQLTPGRYYYNMNVSIGSSTYRIIEGNALVVGGAF
tara:strand:- start:12167 stop:12544 length:378 start_codon:yes stop_codon:yes gene_type:complete